MIKIVKNLPPSGIMTVDQLRMSTIPTLIAAYRSANSNAYNILTKLGKNTSKSGFVPLNGYNEPKYIAENAYEAIETASKNRTVFLFETMEEMLKAMVNKEF